MGSKEKIDNGGDRANGSPSFGVGLNVLLRPINGSIEFIRSTKHRLSVLYVMAGPLPYFTQFKEIPVRVLYIGSMNRTRIFTPYKWRVLLSPPFPDCLPPSTYNEKMGEGELNKSVKLNLSFLEDSQERFCSPDISCTLSLYLEKLRKSALNDGYQGAHACFLTHEKRACLHSDCKCVNTE
ncbi:hypothetical protein Cgig2_003530 [Carnegiea gigantea]|uniref:Uncharacterized protein n=1 Tax=Carnegiea gigantea TaxID=171969 RepID=A0A9Q1GLZ7_9CARY|nr:hypothetical protein Cgig2_003530 [Carnegiea gigantea]